MIDPRLFTDLRFREITRLTAVLDYSNENLREAAIHTLFEVYYADRKYPIGAGAKLELSDISRLGISKLPEPWATRAYLWCGDIDWDYFVFEWGNSYEGRFEYYFYPKRDDLERDLISLESSRFGRYMFESEFRNTIIEWAHDRIAFSFDDPLDDFLDWKNKSTDESILNPLAHDLERRESCRWVAIHDLDSSERRGDAIEFLRRIEEFDRNHPIGPAFSLTADDIKVWVKASGPYVPFDFIEEPWKTRFDQWSSSGGTPFGEYDESWNDFLDLWKDNESRVSIVLAKNKFDISPIESPSVSKDISSFSEPKNLVHDLDGKTTSAALSDQMIQQDRGMSR